MKRAIYVNIYKNVSKESLRIDTAYCCVQKIRKSQKKHTMRRCETEKNALSLSLKYLNQSVAPLTNFL